MSRCHSTALGPPTQAQPRNADTAASGLIPLRADYTSARTGRMCLHHPEPVVICRVALSAPGITCAKYSAITIHLPYADSRCMAGTRSGERERLAVLLKRLHRQVAAGARTLHHAARPPPGRWPGLRRHSVAGKGLAVPRPRPIPATPVGQAPATGRHRAVRPVLVPPAGGSRGMTARPAAPERSLCRVEHAGPARPAGHHNAPMPAGAGRMRRVFSRSPGPGG